MPGLVEDRYQLYALVPNAKGAYDLDGIGVELSAELFGHDSATDPDRMGGATKTVLFEDFTDSGRLVTRTHDDADPEGETDRGANGVATVTFRVVEAER